MPSLSDKLKSLGVKVGAGELRTPAPRRGAGLLDQVLPGRALPTHSGETFLVEARYPAGFHQGGQALACSAPLHGLAAWANERRIVEYPPDEFAFLDTETTGLSGGAGTYAFLIGVGRFEAGEFHLAQFFLRDPYEEPAQLAALEDFLAPCQAVVTFNGKAFDVPLLNARFITHGWRTPFLDTAHLDLLHLARRLWRDRLSSRTLGNLEHQILGTQRTEQDVPGWMIPQLYFDYLRSGDAQPLRSVFYHNAMDVVSLAALFSHTAGLLADPLNVPVEHAVDQIALARLFEELGDLETATRLYLSGLERDLTGEALLDAIQRLALLHKRRDNLAAAVELWQQAARHAHLPALVELAKYAEHRLRDAQQALEWTQSALACLGSAALSAYEQREWQAELEHRQERLLRKLAGGAGPSKPSDFAGA